MEVHDECGHHFLLFRFGFRNHQRNRNQCAVADPFLSIPVQNPVPLQELQKQLCRNPLTAIRKRMILDHEVEQIRSFLFQRRIHFLAEYVLINGIQNPGYFTFFSLHSEYNDFLAYSI